MRASRAVQGFSLLELLVVIGIMGLLSSLLLGAVQRVREAAARVSCQNNLRQIGIANAAYLDRWGFFPAGYHYETSGGRLIGPFVWSVSILPDLDQEALWQASYEAYRIDPRAYRNPPHVGMATVIKSYICPDDPRLYAPLTDADGVTAAFTSYIGVGGNTLYNGMMVGDVGMRPTDITDGTSNTIAVGERPPPISLLAGWWYSVTVDSQWPDVLEKGPYGLLLTARQGNETDCLGPFSFGPGNLTNPCDRYHFWSLHSGGANFLFADGSVRHIAYSAKDVVNAFASRNGGEIISQDW